jgi:hypothetical protein
MASVDRPPIITQATAELPATDDPTELLIRAVDGVATAWAYWITTTDGATARRNGRELLGAAVDALLTARNRYEQARHGS